MRWMMPMISSNELDSVLAVPGRMDTGGAITPPRDSRPGKAKSKAPSKANEGRFEMLNSFVDCQLAECTRAELAVWLVLYRDSRKGMACTAQSWIAKRANVDVRTVRTAIGKLKRRGLVDVVKKGGPSAGLAVYRVHGNPRKGGKHAA